MKEEPIEYEFDTFDQIRDFKAANEYRMHEYTTLCYMKTDGTKWILQLTYTG
jgi:hypothetical protein